jgi:L-asparagine transporter-like permease
MDKTHKGLTAWQLTMMALGTVIGGSFFLGSSVAIRAAGPSIVITYIIGGILVYYILFALSEMTVANPDAGSFRTYAARIFGPGTGFVVGWVYWMGMVLGMSSEATAVSILLRQWIPDIPVSWLSALIIAGVTLLNLMGADMLSKLESGLAAIKILAIVSFIIVAFLLVAGVFSGVPLLNAGSLSQEAFMPGGIKGVAGSLLIIMFAYAGFEIIGIASSEADNPRKTVPKAIKYTVLSLVGLYILSVIAILPLIPTAELGQNISPMVAALNRSGIGWAGTVLNVVLITAILSTMLAAMFGLGRMIRSLADKQHAPKWLKDEQDVPRRGILFSGFGMLAALCFSLLFPSAYLFLISSGGFAILFTYAVIIATQIRFRKKYGCPPEGKCQMNGYPYTSWIVLFVIVIAIFSMPFIPGQTPGLIAGILMVAFFSCIYALMKFSKRSAVNKDDYHSLVNRGHQPGFSMEISKELGHKVDNRDVENGNKDELKEE